MAKNVDEMLKKLFDNKDSNWKPADKIQVIMQEIELHKLDLKTFINNTEFNILDIYKESNELCAESKILIDDLEKCKKEIEEVTMAEILKSIDNYTALSKELQSVTYASNILNDVLQYFMYIQVFDEGRKAGNYTQSVQAVYELLQFLDNPAKGFECLDLYTNLKVSTQAILENLLEELNDEWCRMVQYEMEVSPQKTIITITLKMDESGYYIDVLNGLNICNKLQEQVSQFAQFLLKDVLSAILHNECTVFAETHELMTITVMHKANFKPRYDEVIANLRLLFHYLSNKLNLNFKYDTTIMTMLGDEINVKFRDILVKDCLIDTIPYSLNELQTYGRITSEIEDFQHFLTIIKFFPGRRLSILSYVNNIDVLFADKSSQHFLESARSIMQKDLSLTMSIGVNNIPKFDPIVGPNDTDEQAVDVLDSTIPKSLFFFPRCMISKTAQELLDLVYVMMEQAVQCSDVVCKKLYNTTRLVFELYDAVVPYHHENYLQTIPQYVGLFHNNCMYLAHNLLTFGDKWLILMEGRQLDYPISFVDLVQKLRDLGYKHLTIHMQQQRKQILDNIRSSDLNCIVVKDVLSGNAEAAVRQCLRQLHLLKNVWIGVFPNNVFTRLMATLVNMFMDELIHRVCTVEDISMEMATQLTEIYSLVVQKAPQLFQDPSDIEKHVKSWIKLQELIFVLGGSLKDIEAHWKDGTGPLAVHFKTDELRSLIKALFQNTQIRANLLSKIK